MNLLIKRVIRQRFIIAFLVITIYVLLNLAFQWLLTIIFFGDLHLVKEKLQQQQHTENGKTKVDADRFRHHNHDVNVTDRYMMDYSLKRLNKLFEVLHDAEVKNEQVYRELELFVFNDLVKLWDTKSEEPAIPMANSNALTRKFDQELKAFLTVKDGRLFAKQMLFDRLAAISNYYSFIDSSDLAVEQDGNQSVVFVLAADSNFYGKLEITLFYVHKFYSKYQIIVYDLGLKEAMINKLKQDYNFEVRKFDFEKYSKISPHFKNLQTFAWKPIIIQETLVDYDFVVYLDTSIQLRSDNLISLLNTVKTTGILTQFIGLNLTCYTDAKLFAWFRENTEFYDQLWSIEANLLIMSRNFINSLIMKAWVACALDVKCIAPEGAQVSPCCGCHRFDQSALSTALTFFYGHPRDMQTYLPAFSLTKNQSNFFIIERDP